MVGAPKVQSVKESPITTTAGPSSKSHVMTIVGPASIQPAIVSAKARAGRRGDASAQDTIEREGVAVASDMRGLRQGRQRNRCVISDAPTLHVEHQDASARDVETYGHAEPQPDASHGIDARDHQMGVVIDFDVNQRLRAEKLQVADGAVDIR